MNPGQMLVNFLTNIVGQISFLAWPLLILSIAVAALKGINELRETGRWPIWSTVGFLVGGVILWYIVAYPATIAAWICSLMGVTCPGA